MSRAMTRQLPDPIYDAAFYTGIPVKRLIAWIIDVLLIGFLTFLAGFVTLSVAWFLFPLFYLAISFTYRWLTLAAGSATFGMRIMSIEIRNGSGLRLESNEAMLHTLSYLVCVAFAPLQFISAIMMIMGPRRQGLHDLFLGTAAINRPR